MDHHHAEAVEVDRDNTSSLLNFTSGPDANPAVADAEDRNEGAPEIPAAFVSQEGNVETGENPQVQAAEDKAQAASELRAETEGQLARPMLLYGFNDLRQVAARRRQPPIWGNVRRGLVSLVVGQPGVGKSQYVAQAGIAMATGRPFGGYMPSGEHRVVFLSPEDEADILVDRIEAVAGLLRADMDIVERNLKIVHHEDSCVLFEPGPKGTQLTDMGRAFFAEVDDFRADAVFMDPMAELHRLPEMDNGAMNGLLAALRTRARLGNYAVVLTHHSVKPDKGDAPPTIHTARGAGATGASIRHADVLSELSKKERADFGITDEAAPDYVRLDVVKSSYRRRPGKPTYFRRVEVPVNGTTAPAMEMIELQPRGR
ncbi:MAG: AAA family ATPase [Acidocella sp.]|nr:AAA family ATPase [Acidocella sp.]